MSFAYEPNRAYLSLSNVAFKMEHGMIAIVPPEQPGQLCHYILLRFEALSSDVPEQRLSANCGTSQSHPLCLPGHTPLCLWGTPKSI